MDTRTTVRPAESEAAAAVVVAMEVASEDRPVEDSEAHPAEDLAEAMAVDSVVDRQEVDSEGRPEVGSAVDTVDRPLAAVEARPSAVARRTRREALSEVCCVVKIDEIASALQKIGRAGNEEHGLASGQ